MDTERIKDYQQQLGSRAPLIGGWLRRRAAAALLAAGTPAAARALAEVAASAVEPAPRAVALAALAQVTAQPAIDAVCAVWETSRDAGLADLLTERGWVADAPLATRVLSALKTGRLAVVTAGWAEVVAPLLAAGGDGDPAIAERAGQALRELVQPAAREALCQVVIDTDDPRARAAVVAAGYAPREPHQRALLFFLTDQWARYEALDFEQTMLRAAQAVGDAALRRRVAEGLRRAGRADWVGVLTGSRQSRPLGDLTDAEWAAALAVLVSREQWPEVWRLAQAAPARWSARLLRRLEVAGWRPEGPEERAGLAHLIDLARGCGDEPPGLGGLMGPRATLTGHRAPVTTLAFSPDSRLLVSGCTYPDSRLHLWAVATGEHLVRLRGHDGGITGLAFHPAGTLLASGSFDTTVRLWDPTTYTAVATLDGGAAWVEGLAFSPDGRLLAAGSDDRAVRLWQPPTAAPVLTLAGHSAGLTNLAFTPDGRALATGGKDGGVRLWSLAEPAAARVLAEAGPAITGLALAPTGQVLVAGAADGTLRFWSLPSGVLMKSLAATSLGVNCLAVSPTGRVVASADGDWAIRLWGLPNGADLATLTGHGLTVKSLTFSADGLLLVSGGADGDIRLWDVAAGRELVVLSEHREAVQRVALSPDGLTLASAGNDKVVRLWESVLARLCRRPVSQTSLAEMDWAAAAMQESAMTALERRWLALWLELTRWRRRHDIALEAAPAAIAVGEFDIEIDG